MYKRNRPGVQEYKGKPGPEANGRARNYVMQIPLNAYEQAFVVNESKRLNITMAEFVRRSIFGESAR
jgi:hypothetical protein